MLLCTQVLAQPMSGVRIIGSTGHFSSIQDAADALVTNGLNGNLVFLIQSGTYNEQVKIDSFNHNGYKVAFKSYTGNKEDVLITHTHTSAGYLYNHTILLDGADNISFSDLSFEAQFAQWSGFAYGNIIVLIDKCEHIEIKNCAFNSFTPTNTNNRDMNSHIYAGESSGRSIHVNDLIIENCSFNEGIGGITLNGPYSATPKSKNFNILKNTFTNQLISGVHIRYGGNINIEGNDIRYHNAYYNSFMGLSFEYITDSCSVSSNYLLLRYSGRAINAAEINNSGFTITNNQIICLDSTNNQVSMGIFLVAVDSARIEHNSFLQFSKDSNNSCINLYQSENNIILNNILSAPKGASILFKSFNSTISFFTDYNVYYHTGPLFKSNTQSISQLTGMQSYFNGDSNSLIADPNYNNDSLLVPNSVAVYDTGFYTGKVTKDYYGTIRSTTKPDIGCYEGNLKFNNITVDSIGFEAVYHCLNDTLKTNISFTNNGIDTISSFKIEYKINQEFDTILQWNGALAPDSSVSNFSLVGYKLTHFDKLNLTVSAFNINNTTDDDTTDNTIQHQKYISLSGYFNIGNSPAYFQSIGSALDRLSKAGICDEVVFLLEDTVYYEKLKIDSFPVFNGNAKVTFQGVFSDSIKTAIEYSTLGTTNAYIMLLNAADKLLFRHITFRGYKNEYEALIRTQGHVKDLTFDSCNFIGSALSNYINYLIDYTSPLDKVAFNHCQFIAGRYQMYMQTGVGIDGLSINKCHFSTPVIQSLYLQNLKHFSLVSNEFLGHSQSWISLLLSSDSVIIEKNLFNVSTSFKSVLNIESCSGTDNNPLLIKNNIFNVSNGTSNSAIILSQNNALHFYNNTIVDHIGASPVVLYRSPFTGVLKNNIIYSNSLKAALHVSFPLQGAIKLPISNNNIFYNTDSTALRYMNNTYNLTQWRAAFSIDQNSYFERVGFKNTPILHLDTISYANASAAPSAFVKFDFDGDTRDSLLPDIGADEFDVDSFYLIDRDPKIELINLTQCSLKDTLIFKITNHDTLTIDSFQFKVYIFKNLIYDQLIKSSIAKGDSIIVELNSLNVNPNTFYSISAELEYNSNGKNKEIKEQFEHQYLGDFNIQKHQIDLCSNEVILSIPFDNKIMCLWSTGEQYRSIKTSQKAIYSVVVTDNNGCVVQREIDLR